MKGIGLPAAGDSWGPSSKIKIWEIQASGQPIGWKAMAPDASTMKKPAAAATTLKRSATQQPAKGILKIPAAQSTRKRKEMEDKEEGEGEEEEPLEDDEEILPKLTTKALQGHESFCVEAKDLNEEKFCQGIGKAQARGRPETLEKVSEQQESWRCWGWISRDLEREVSWELTQEEEASSWLDSAWKDLWWDLQGVHDQGHLH